MPNPELRRRTETSEERFARASADPLPRGPPPHLPNRESRVPAWTPPAADASRVRRESPDTANQGPAPKLKTPSWDGAKEELDEFLHQCRLQFRVNSRCFPTQAMRVDFAISCLTGDPRRRAICLEEADPNNERLHDWGAFEDDLRLTYGDADPVATAHETLITMKQKGSARSHISEIRALAARCGVPEGPHLVTILKNGLRRELRERALHLADDHFGTFAAGLIRIERAVEELKRCTVSTPANARPAQTAIRSDRRPRARERLPANSRPAPAKPAVGGRPFDAVYQQRKEQGKCYTCGGDHLRRDCPSQGKIGSNKVEFNFDCNTVLFGNGAYSDDEPDWAQAVDSGTEEDEYDSGNEGSQ